MQPLRPLRNLLETFDHQLATQGEKRLLIVDDEPDFADFVGRVGRQMGYEARVTSSARDFQEAYEAFNPTVIVMDVVMPEMDGVELIGWLAGHGCQAKVIVVSGYNPHYMDWTRHLGGARGLGTVESYPKPISLGTLRDALR